MNFDELRQTAHAVVAPRDLSPFASAGSVGAALVSDSGAVYTGVCIETACSMGFCAEHAAAAAMVTRGENRVVRMVAVDVDGRVTPPCGRCREFISQLHAANAVTEVLVNDETVVTLQQLLPFDWRTDATDAAPSAAQRRESSA
ncbi:MAG: cytidine deaminase [Nitriliruptoraceae bacterium]